jgi:hypothetical protein
MKLYGGNGFYTGSLSITPDHEKTVVIHKSDKSFNVRVWHKKSGKVTLVENNFPLLSTAKKFAVSQ